MNNKVLRNNQERLRPNFQEELKITSDIVSCKKKCRCGHTQLVPKRKEQEFILCSWCNGRLYADDEKQKAYEKKRQKAEFIYQITRIMKYDKEAIL